MEDYDYWVIGGGIVGIEKEKEVKEEEKGERIIVMEKERGIESKKKGNNRGVINEGIY